ncbi:E1 replication protein [Caretta caretta papillomavirus 1]|uniref:DNA 3'-5' helicase n=2 Tax=Caretta caretta papillomavirus 1 TaxID=485241 RepID=B6RUQ0_9PAPI|nr:E1 [Caretta caretta papillomavirus 1]ACD39814.1 E1 replication protein [Caretta caretta papillomavirus 1]
MADYPESPDSPPGTYSDLFDNEATEVYASGDDEVQEEESDETLAGGQGCKRRLPSTPGSATDVGEALSPQFDALQLSRKPRSKKCRRKLNMTLDSECGNSTCAASSTPAMSALAFSFEKRSQRIKQQALFKDSFMVSFSDISRQFKSNKTQSNGWVFALFDYCMDITHLHNALKETCTSILTDHNPTYRSYFFLCDFISRKSRESLLHLIRPFGVAAEDVHLCEPPNTRSVPAAVFFTKVTLLHGMLPLWIQQLTAIGDSNADQFKLVEMIQWAYDNNYTEESRIAYEYAKLATEDTNAKAWLKNNSQAKYVKDCAVMVRLYKKGEVQAMSLSDLIVDRCEHFTVYDPDGWKNILLLLRFQQIPLAEFLKALKDCLHCVPKKCCLAFVGVPDSGKSMLCMSLIEFLEGRVLSFSNARSHFWLQPLGECKIALIDDATKPCWQYIETYMRNALDGNPVCLDAKYKAPVQIRCPPILITSNVDIRQATTDADGMAQESDFKYLLNRISIFPFCRPIPVREGRLRFTVQTSDWKSFFLTYSSALEFDLTDYQDGCEHETDGNAG